MSQTCTSEKKNKPQHQQSLISLQAGLDRPLLQTFETIQNLTLDITEAVSELQRIDAVPRFQTQIPFGRSSTPSTDYVQYIVSKTISGWTEFFRLKSNRFLVLGYFSEWNSQDFLDTTFLATRFGEEGDLSSWGWIWTWQFSQLYRKVSICCMFA